MHGSHRCIDRSAATAKLQMEYSIGAEGCKVQLLGISCAISVSVFFVVICCAQHAGGLGAPPSDCFPFVDQALPGSKELMAPYIYP